MRMQSLRPERCLETGHEQRRPDPFSGYISDRDPPSPVRQREKVVIVAANPMSWLVEGLAGYAWNRQASWREKCLLNVLGSFQIPPHRPLNSRFRLRFLQI